MLVAEGKLEEADGAFRPVGDLGDLAVPETLHALIAARLDALDAGDRGLLQDASVLGQTFSIESLAELRGETPEVIEARLRGLARREVLVLDTRSTIAGAGPVRLRPGPPARGRLLHPGPNRPSGPPPGRGALFRGHRRRPDGRRPGHPLPRCVSSHRPRAMRRSLWPPRPGSRCAAPPIGRSRWARTIRRSPTSSGR